MRKYRGFTVVELVIVMAIMAILLTIATVSFRQYQIFARDKEREADVAALQTYLESIYPQEIRDSSGRVIKEAGTYPALMMENGDDWKEWDVVFKDLSKEVLSPPGIKTDQPSVPRSRTSTSGYIPEENREGPCGYYYCYTRPNNITGDKDKYIYAPGPNGNELCTKRPTSTGAPTSTETSKCRRYIIVYKTEVDDRKIVVESKRK